MPLDKLVLIIVVVILAAGLTVAAAAFLQAAGDLPALATLVAVPLLLIAYVIVRVIADRVRNAEDRRYDRIER